MTLKRLIMQIRFWMFLGNGNKRAKYAKKKRIYAEIGEGSKIPSTLPLYPGLVKIHKNVTIHHSVKLVTHDMVNAFLAKSLDIKNLKNVEAFCPIEIFDNVYIGMNTIVLGNVRIGPNAIINAGSLITKDVPPNSIVEGVPAKVIGDFDKYAKIRTMLDKAMPYELKRSSRESIDQKTAEIIWKRFDKKKNVQKGSSICRNI